MNTTSRRDFIHKLGLLTAGCGLTGSILPPPAATGAGVSWANSDMFFTISLAQWSLHRALKSGHLDNLDFPAKAKKEFGISAVEYVNVFFKDKATDLPYLTDLRTRCSDNGVRSLLIMCDAEGSLADLDPARRQQAVENHYKWIDASRFLGGHSIRVNCTGEGSFTEVARAGVDGLRKLCEYGKTVGINVVVENHEGKSEDGHWISNVIKEVGMPNCGTLPDFGNFHLGNNTWYDRYKGVREMMPFAKAVSAKTHDFDAEGNCVETDYARMLPIVKEAGYRGFIGIEYEGNKLSEEEGIRATKKLLERVGVSLN